jgi:hypothetical protein
MPISRNYVQNTPSCPVRLCYHEIFRLDRYRRSVEERSAEYATSSLGASKPRQALSFLNPLVEVPLAQDATDSATAANHWQSLALD